MKKYSEKELVPVIYGESSVKVSSYTMVKNQKPFPKHWHERMEFHIVKSGTLKLICDGEELLVNSGEISIISPSVTHIGGPENEGVKYDVIMFDPVDLYNETISAKQYLKPLINGFIRFNYKTDNAQILAIANSIVEMQNKNGYFHPLENVGLLYQLLGLLYRYCINKEYKPLDSTKKFDNIIKYIDSNFTKSISINMLCDQFCYEKSYFCRKFKSITGITTSEYLRIKRLEYSCELLKNTDYSIKYIALQCNFNDSAYFINCFKKAYGITPLKYKKTNRQP